MTDRELDDAIDNLLKYLRDSSINPTPSPEDRHQHLVRILLPIRIDMARNGDLEAARRLCLEAGEFLVNDLPLPSEIARYLGEALVSIAKDNSNPAEALNLQRGRGRPKESQSRDVEIASLVALLVEMNRWSDNKIFSHVGEKFNKSGPTIRTIYESNHHALSNRRMLEGFLACMSSR